MEYVQQKLAGDEFMTDIDNKDNHLELSDRGNIDPFIVMDLMSDAAALELRGENIIHMEVGQPGTPAPDTAIKAAQHAMVSDRLGYTLALGINPLRERISQYYMDLHELDVPAERIIITTGSSAGFLLAFLACFDHGMKVAMPRPGYPCYRQILSALGLKPVDLVLSAVNRWMPDSFQLASAIQQDQVSGIILASPANPTGTMLSDERLASLVKTAVDNRIWFISDEIYHGLTYEAPATTALKYSDEVIVINSFSKYFSMTGWRIGWMVVPDNTVRTFERLAQNLFISVPTISQYAALGAFEGIVELEEHKNVYSRNRKILLDGLPTLGITEILPADGAFYIYADMSRFTENSVEFCQKMLRETGVAATPGQDFDPVNGKKYIRFSYSGKTSEISEALTRLGSWLPGDRI